jgi:hypothetical protein
MVDLFCELKNNLANLDLSQNRIQKVSDDFIKLILTDESSTKDAIEMWKYFIFNKSEKLCYIFLANDIIQNSSFRNLKIHEEFFKHLIEVFPMLFNSLNEKVRIEIFRLLEIWQDRKIYEDSKIEDLTKLLVATTNITIETLKNPLFENFILNQKIKISDKIKNYATNLDEFITLKNKTEIDDDYKRQMLINLNRGKFLTNTADIIKKQNQVYFRHAYYLQEVDKMLDKIADSKEPKSSENN